jgi:hypothetical protein
MNCWPSVLDSAVGLQWPTPLADAAAPRTWTTPASSSRVQQGGTGDGRIGVERVLDADDTAVGLAVGLVVPPYGLPSTNPTPPGSAGRRCLWQRAGDRGGRRRGFGHSPALLTGRGRLTPDRKPRRSEFPLGPPSFAPSAADSRRTVRHRRRMVL